MKVYRVYTLLHISYWMGIEHSVEKKYFSTKGKAECEFNDTVASFSNPPNECKVEELSPLSVKITESGNKWVYELSVVKDVIRIY